MKQVQVKNAHINLFPVVGENPDGNTDAECKTIVNPKNKETLSAPGRRGFPILREKRGS